MKFGVREICDVVFKALHTDKIGSMDVKKGQPVLFIDSAKTSTIEGAATTVYAQGGRGNSRLLTWEGEKTLTFTVEDALLSEVGFAILSGAGLFKHAATTSSGAVTGNEYVDGSTTYNARVHCSEIVYAEGSTLVLEHEPDSNSPIFVMKYEDGSIGDQVGSLSIHQKDKNKLTGNLTAGQYFVDYYYLAKAEVTELQIDAENFAGHYYVEASTLFRRESDGKDLPAEIVFPKVKIQSNFTFNMASTGDPSTFSFVMDAMPGYTMFNKEKKVLCAMQVINDDINDEVKYTPVTSMKSNEKAGFTDAEANKNVLDNDSITDANA